MQADMFQSAQNYRLAFMEGDTSVQQDRNALHDYLARRARGSDVAAASATDALARFWP